jgi:hypothetical protein
MYTYICNTNSLSLSLSLALSRCHTHTNTTHKHHTHTHIHTHAYLALLSGRSPANFRISQLRFAKSRLRFACVSPGYVCGRSPCSFNNKQEREKSNLKRKEIGSDNSEVPELEIFNYKLLAQYNFFALSVKRRAALSGV